MKKAFMAIIALVVVGMTVAPTVSAQDMQKLQQLQNEVERIESAAKARGGSYTPQETQRLQQIQQEMMQAAGGFGGTVPQTPSTGGANPYLPPQVNQEAQRQQQQVGQVQKGEAPSGTRTGWPSAGDFRVFTFALTAPRTSTANGITTYYGAEGDYLAISLHKNWVLSRSSFAATPFTAQELQAIKREIEQASGLRLDRDGNAEKKIAPGTGRGALPTEGTFATISVSQEDEWIYITLNIEHRNDAL